LVPDYNDEDNALRVAETIAKLISNKKTYTFR
jgi:hypothetical protein